jgi:pimeloyl-ACP methyl ester carboxylesterase
MLWLNGYAVPASGLDVAVAQFSDEYTCITFDYLGSGRSAPARRFLTSRTMATDGLKVLDHLGISEPAVVHGISLGGMVAQELALMEPDRVRALVLGSTSAGGCDSFPADPWTTLTGLLGVRSHAVGGSGIRANGAVAQSIAAATHEAGRRLEDLHIPTLVLHGRHDQLMPVRNAQVLAARIPGATLHLLTEGGHLYMDDQPEYAAEVVRTWLRGLPPTSPIHAGSGDEPARRQEPCLSGRHGMSGKTKPRDAEAAAVSASPVRRMQGTGRHIAAAVHRAPARVMRAQARVAMVGLRMMWAKGLTRPSNESDDSVI